MGNHTRWKQEKDGELSYCGDHYCSGHQRYIVRCECGKVLYRGEYIPSGDSLKVRQLEHRMEELGG